MQVNVHLSPTSLKFAGRIMRITQAITKSGLADRILIIGVAGANLPALETLPACRELKRLPLRRFAFLGRRWGRLARYLEWLLRAYSATRQAKPFMVNCHTIFDFPIGYCYKLRHSCILVYDTHELETERNGMKEIQKKVWRIVESWMIKHCDLVVCVNHSIARWYREKYALSTVIVARNIPSASQSYSKEPIHLKKELDIPSGSTLFLYQGLFISGRGIPLLIEIFQERSNNQHIIFLGFGPLRELIRNAAAFCPRIHLQDAVPPTCILSYTASADVGLALIENTCLSYYLSLPNKVFEYFHAGIPLIGSDFPEISKFILEYDCGWIASPSKNQIMKLLDQLTPEVIEQKRLNISKTKGFPVWETEVKEMLASYKKVLNTKKAYSNLKTNSQ